MDAQTEDSISGQSATEYAKINELIVSLSKAQHDLSICQKKNRSLRNELKLWKGRASEAEESLKEEKRNNQSNITQLGFKMLQFENELRREQRDIEHKFIEKDQQIKILQDVISSLHSKMKTNSLCYNCFLTKHSSQDQSTSQDSYIAKFPLDMDFHDHKSTGHTGHESRNRNISLPLNIQSPHESPRANGEFCFHHMLSPVPEELENSFIEHARRENLQMTIEEEEEEDEEETDKEVKIEEKNKSGKLEENIAKNPACSVELESKSSGESIQSLNLEEEGLNDVTRKQDQIMSHVINNPNDIPIDEDENIESNDQYTKKITDDVSGCLDSNDNVSFDIKLLLEELIRNVELIQSNVGSNEFMNDIKEETVGEENEQESIDKMALSPKSEALVAELKRAIVEASMEVEKATDNPVSDSLGISNCSSQAQEDRSADSADTSLVGIEEIDFELSSVAL
ncbi:putative leucine-rich repeat-containing protein DDB_G0290503 isoform X2 [Rhopilema esculentum]|uniref:putative leucine-rich repeat-containing protein DDB_G0290503 isoform X2 n=1 Tax=Rhopilema esculentum TaxID=499914 RepID=UPI0031DBB647